MSDDGGHILWYSLKSLFTPVSREFDAVTKINNEEYTDTSPRTGEHGSVMMYSYILLWLSYHFSMELRHLSCLIFQDSLTGIDKIV